MSLTLYRRRARRTGVRLAGAAAIIGLSVGTSWVAAQQSKEPGEYPEPSFPRWLADPSEEQLMDAARFTVRQTSGRAPLGVVQSGQTVHVFLSYDQDMEVWDAIKRAWAERGVDAVAVRGWEWLGLTREEYVARAERNLIHGSEGWKEFGVFEPAFVPFLPPDVQDDFGDPMTTTALLGGIEYTSHQRRSAFGDYLDDHPEIQNFFAFAGGRGHVQRLAGPKHAEKFKGNWVHFTKFDLLDKSSRFPSDVWKMIDETMVRPIPHVAEGTFRDPEGTRLHWVLTPEQTRSWEQKSGLSSYEPGHLNIYPPPARALWKEGVIAAAGTHTAFHPSTMTVHLSERGRVTRIEGGGKSGELFRALLDHPKLKNADFPTAPEQGYWYLTQDGLGTNPKRVRNMALLEGAIELANLSERNRAGVQHLSFAAAGRSFTEQDLAYAQERGIPVSHTAHMHVYFPTVRWKLRDTGEWITMIDKGRLAVFDNPEIRALASRYGDPDVLFSYDWIPAIPGINAAGDYETDYAQNPWGRISSVWERIKDGTYEHYVADYDMFSDQSRSGKKQ